LAWQLCLDGLHEFLKKHLGFPSLLDEKLFMWKTSPKEQISTHVDGLATAAVKACVNWLFSILKLEFGNATTQVMPSLKRFAET